MKQDVINFPIFEVIKMLEKYEKSYSGNFRENCVGKFLEFLSATTK